MSRRSDTRLLARTLRTDDGEDTERPLDLGVLRRLLALTRPHAKKRNWLIAMVTLRAMGYPAVGWASAAILSGPVAHGDLHGTALSVLGLLALVLAAVVVMHYRIKLALELGEAVIHDLRGALVRHLFSLPLAFFQKQRVGRILGRLTSDLEAVRVGVKDVVFVSAVQIGAALGAVALMLRYDVRLFAVVALLAPVLIATIRFFQGRLMHAYRLSTESFGRVTATIAESIAGIRITQAHDRGALNGRAFGEQIVEHADLNVFAARRAAALVPLLDLNGELFLALLVLLGGYRALHAEIELEVLVQFFFLSTIVFQAIPIVGQQIGSALTAMASAERVFALLDQPPPWRDAAEARPIGRIAGAVELRDVGFAYTPERPVLVDLSLRVEPGQTVALVGPTGGGKSTLLGLLAKFHLPSAGVLSIDGVDIRHVTSDSLRRQVGIVQQQNYLFTGSVLDNVRVGRADASDADVIAAARALDVLDLIEAFPRGWETRLGERGHGLSLGERQIVCFTRAMLADPRLLLLDEATSALDALTERRLQSALARLLAGRTSFVVAHRLSTIRSADQLLVLEGGRIVERGTHESLLALDGKYARLHRHYVS